MKKTKNLNKILVILIGLLLLSKNIMAQDIKDIDIKANQIDINIKGEELEIDNILYRDRTYIAVRNAGNIFNKGIIYDEAAKTVYLKSDNKDKQIVDIDLLEEDSIPVIFNMVDIYIEDKLFEDNNFIYKGRTYIPLRSMAESLNKRLIWDEKNHSIDILDMEDTEYLKGIEYSNLVDRESQLELRESMELANIDKSKIDRLFKDIDKYNNIVGKENLLDKGFKNTENLEIEYNVLSIIDNWNNKENFIGNNCRITSYHILDDLIDIDNPNTKNSDNLFMDMDSIENNPEKIFNSDKIAGFKTIFGLIPTEDTKDIDRHIRILQEDWKEKGIKFNNKDASLISVVFHSDLDNSLFIGHAGVLFKDKNDGLLFLEKISFEEPYQLIRFKNRIELNDYLMNKYDISWGQPTAKPFILENDKLINGYRENPNNIEK